METYKGLQIPNIKISKLPLEYEDDLHCLVNYTSTREVGCDGVECSTCIFHKYNINIAVEYSVGKGYITKEKAMRISLDG